MYVHLLRAVHIVQTEMGSASFQGILGWHELLSGVGADGPNSFGKESFVVTSDSSFS